MHLDDTAEEAEFRHTARAWIEANAPHHLDAGLAATSGFGHLRLPGYDTFAEAKAWQKRKADGGWACMHWPVAYGGRAATPGERAIFQQEEGLYARLGHVFNVGQGMCGPTLMAYCADEDLKARLLPKIVSGDEVWCQLFSEPSAGSDVAALRTRAVRDGDEWVIDGQKIWTSNAQVADWGLLLARTDPDVPKHKGLTMFIIDMRMPGVEVRPIVQMSGEQGFNEVFFTGARIPDAWRLGAVGDGWQVSITTLMNERATIGARLQTGFSEIMNYCGRAIHNGRPVIEDAAVRSRLANWAARDAGLRRTYLRMLSSLSRGETPGPENSIGKLVTAAMVGEIARFALDLQGEAGVLAEPDEAPAAGMFQHMLMVAPGRRIAGGTDEILRNVIAERVLGLPADIRVDKTAPFRDLRT